MLKKIIVILLIFSVTAGLSANSASEPEVAAKVIPVASVSDLRDDDEITIEGYLIKQLSEEHYLFRDDTAEIEVEIDDDLLQDINIDETVKIRITGEVDKDEDEISVEADTLQLVEN